MAELDLRDLKKAIDAIFDRISNDLKVEKRVIKNDQDYNWEVRTDALYDVKKTQPQLDVGRLSDDWNFLKAITKD